MAIIETPIALATEVAEVLTNLVDNTVIDSFREIRYKGNRE